MSVLMNILKIYFISYNERALKIFWLSQLLKFMWILGQAPLNFFFWYWIWIPLTIDKESEYENNGYVWKYDIEDEFCFVILNGKKNEWDMNCVLGRWQYDFMGENFDRTL